jgi:uncharacterized damage-inducible protein DinB
MKMTDLFLAELERESAPTRRTLERVPDERPAWKPHEKSMQLSHLSTHLATLPSWVVTIVNQDELDMDPAAGPSQPELRTSRELVQALDANVAKARTALSNTNDEHLMKPWKFLVAGRLVSEQPRYVMLRDAVFNHVAHHRGQLTVYLRLNDVPVPSIYGPSADEPNF